MCTRAHTHTHTHTRTRGGARGAFGPPSPHHPPGGVALRKSQWIYAVSYKAWSTLPTGGVVAGGGPMAPFHPPPARARMCVCAYTYICDIF